MRGTMLAIAVGAGLAWMAARAAMRSGRAPEVWMDAKRRVERCAIRWSGDLLRSMGAVETAPRAEQEALLAHKVKSAIAERLETPPGDLVVLIIGGVIHLEGQVGSAGERAEAERIARGVSGALVIADDLRVDAGWGRSQA